MIEMNYTLLELYSMYKRCVRYKMHCESQRDRGHYGIAVNDDKPARAWQKYNKLQGRIDCELIRGLERDHIFFSPVEETPVEHRYSK